MSPIYAHGVHATILLTVAQWGWPDDGLTKSQAENLYLGAIVICGLAILFALRQFQKVGTRVAMVVVLAALAGFLYWQRDEVQDCAGQCTCTILGRELAIRDENAFCPE